MKVNEYFNPKPRKTTDALVKKLFKDSSKTKREQIRRKRVFRRNLPV